MATKKNESFPAVERDTRAGVMLRGLMEAAEHNAADILKLVKLTMREMGGYDVLARELSNLLTSSETPPMTRQKALSDFIRLMTMVQDRHGKPADLTTIPTEELEAMVGDVLRQRYGDQEEAEVSARGPADGTARPGHPATAESSSWEAGGGI